MDKSREVKLKDKCLIARRDYDYLKCLLKNAAFALGNPAILFERFHYCCIFVNYFLGLYWLLIFINTEILL